MLSFWIFVEKFVEMRRLMWAFQQIYFLSGSRSAKYFDWQTSVSDWEHLRVWLIGLSVAESASPLMSASISLVISLGLGIARSERPVKLACTNYENYLRFKDFDWPPENIKRFKIEPKNTWEKDILVTFWKIVFCRSPYFCEKKFNPSRESHFGPFFWRFF